MPHASSPSTAAFHAPHAPVLLDRVLAALAPRDDALYVDGTFGAGGYSQGILDAAACRVVGIDRDPAAVEAGRALESQAPGRFTMLKGRFGAMDALLAEAGFDGADGVALDIGVSSMQLDQAERGFSFRFDGPLDMRMGDDGPTAADLVNETAEADLHRLIRDYGEEKRARRVARAIAETRRETPFERTGRLAEVVRRAVGQPRGAETIDPATRTFQALRIAVNDELGELERGLAAAERLLRPGGRLAVVSFHSLEDRVVKSFLRDRSGNAPGPSRHAPAVTGAEPTFRLLFRRPETPGEDEITVNPRARSARLRAAERTATPSREGQP